MHLAAKQLIEARGALAFPALVISISVVDAGGRLHAPSTELVSAGQRALSNVVLEQALGEIRPDVIVDAEGIGGVLVEVAVTHFVDEQKLSRIARRGVAAVEIDLSTLRDATFASLEEALFDDPSRTAWLYHPLSMETKTALRASIQSELDAAADTQRAYEKAERLREQQQQAVWRQKVAEQRKLDEAKRKTETYQRQVEAALEAARKAEAEAQLRQSRHETLRKASAFKARPEEHKRIILLNRLGLSELPAFIGADVPGSKAFGVDDPLVWQTAFFGGLIHKQAAAGRGWLSTKFARAWMSYRFFTPPRLAKEAADAIDAYLDALSDAGALVPGKNGSFAIAVGDLACFETLREVHADPSFHPSRFQWTPQDEWPCATQVTTLTNATVTNRHRTGEWIHLSRNLHSQRTHTPMEICTWASGFGGSKEAVARYLVRTGFLRLKPKDT